MYIYIYVRAFSGLFDADYLNIRERVILFGIFTSWKYVFVSASMFVIHSIIICANVTTLKCYRANIFQTVSEILKGHQSDCRGWNGSY